MPTREGLDKNTVIIFTSDNGYNSGSHGFGDKVIPYEEGSKAPLIIFDPRLPKEHAGKVSDAVTDNLRVIAHPKDAEKLDLVKQANQLAVGEWHRVIIKFTGSTMTVTEDETTFTMSNNFLAEEKHHFSLCGDSGGAEGEKAGALEFRKLIITTR